MAPPCLWDCCGGVEGLFHTIPTVGILSRPNPYRGIPVNRLTAMASYMRPHIFFSFVGA
jgi:hypothetical protein